MQKPNSSPWLRNGLLITMTVTLFVTLMAIWWSGSGRPSIAGTYLAAGGTEYVVITGGRVSGNLLQSPFEGKAYGGKSSLRLDVRLPGTGSPDHEEAVIFELTPSAGRSGDYDLQSVESLQRRTNPFLAFWDDLLSAYRSSGPVTTNAPPIAAYLHRVDNPLVEEYFRIAYCEPAPPVPGQAAVPSTETSDIRIAPPGPRSAELASLANRLVVAHPDDLHVRILLLDALIRMRDRKELGKRIDSWRAEYTASAPGNPMLAAAFAEAERQARGLALSERGRNGFSHLIRALSPTTDLPARYSLLAELFSMEEMIPPRPLTGRDHTVMNFLELQVLAKLGRVEVSFLLLQGRHDEARALALSLYRYGQLIESSDDFLVTRLVGIALRSLAAGGLQKLALNGCTTTTETETLQEAMNKLARFETPTERVNLNDGAPVPFPSLGTAHTPNYDEVRVRHRVANTKFELVRTANAVRHHLLAHGHWPDPGSPEVLHPLLSDGIPADVFSPTTAPLNLLHEPATDAMVVYSVGPDGRNDGATIDYDPTNGTISAGDIAFRIPRERKYPFPTQGVQRVESIEEWNHLFPHGLPVDPFADTKGRGLSVAQTSESLYIYSVGPDTDESTIARLPDYVPTVAYDPTNGTVSSGDMFIRIPVRAGEQ